ncbi:MAG TPA: DEAD/DEAH box helicase [Actinomycetota bacterium]
MSESTFADLGVSAGVVTALASRGIERPFPIQALVMADALGGRDVLAKSRTGSGKTLAFALPIVERVRAGGPKPSALVLVPTRELAVQVADEFREVARAKNLKVALAYGGTRVVEQGKRAASSDIVIATPGRLEDLAQRRMVSLEGVSMLVLDEADRMLDMGFQPQVDRIVKRLGANRQTMFFSATLDGQVGRLARSYTRDARLHEVESPRETVDEADHRFIPVTAQGKVDALIEFLGEDRAKTLVFVRTKRGADRLAWKLRQQGIKCVAMHGDLSQPVRERALRDFESGKIHVLVATDIAARGLDLERISHVVNYDPPEDDKAYVHRVGRTARAGRPGTGVTFVTPEQQGDIGRMAARLKLHEDFEAEGMKVAPPRIVFSGKAGRYSNLRRQRARR